MPTYTAVLMGDSCAPMTRVCNSIRAARAWAQEQGTLADVCNIMDGTGRLVAQHRRDTSETRYGKWFRATVPPASAEIGRRGGQARAAAMTPEARSEASRKAVQARWAKRSSHK